MQRRSAAVPRTHQRPHAGRFGSNAAETVPDWKRVLNQRVAAERWWWFAMSSLPAAIPTRQYLPAKAPEVTKR
jgi:hypothetical protein